MVLDQVWPSEEMMETISQSEEAFPRIYAWDPESQVFRDRDGVPVADKFGKPLAA